MKKEIMLVSEEFIRRICRLYGDKYDDQIEDSRPPTAGKKNGVIDSREAGADWFPGEPSMHKSLSSFQKELKELYDIRLSSSKIRKILISGGLWTTERSREIQVLYERFINGSDDYPPMKPEQAVIAVSEELKISRPLVSIHLPYSKGVNGLEEKSKNAIRCEKYRRRKAEKQ